MDIPSNNDRKYLPEIARSQSLFLGQRNVENNDLQTVQKDQRNFNFISESKENNTASGGPLKLKRRHLSLTDFRPTVEVSCYPSDRNTNCTSGKLELNDSVHDTKICDEDCSCQLCSCSSCCEDSRCDMISSSIDINEMYNPPNAEDMQTPSFKDTVAFNGCKYSTSILFFN